MSARMVYDETPAEKLFRESGPFVHLHTSPKESDVFYRNDKEREVALNMMAMALYTSGCRMLAFAMMDNHFHFILMGSSRLVSAFWEELSGRLDRYFNRQGRAGMLDDVQATPTPISNLIQLRTEITYVIRNSFVVHTGVHVFADRWSSGHLYFNPILEHSGVSASTLKGRALRAFTHTRQGEVPDSRIFVQDGVAQPWSFVDYQFAEKFFDNARQFVNSVLKNIEAQVETARRLGERPFLSDDELRPIVYKLCRESFRAESPSALDENAKKRLAVLLKNNYGASNKQIARLVRMLLRDVDALFPLAATPRQA